MTGTPRLKLGPQKSGQPAGLAADFGAHLLLIFICVVLVVLLHLPLLRQPNYWDEAGYYVPAAHDLYLHGDLIPTTTVSNPHPPLLSIYLAAAWKLFGFSPLVTRLAMALLAGLALYAVLLLALVLVTPAAGLWAAALTLTASVFFAQSTLAHLDVGATFGTLLVLYFYFRRRLVACVLAAALLCLLRETGAVLVLTLAFVEQASAPAKGGAPSPRFRWWLLLSLLPLAAWFVFVKYRTGLWLGDSAFAEYNVWGVLNPVRWVLQLLKRLHQLLIANFHWVATLLIAVAARRSAFSIRSPERRVLLAVMASYVAFLSVFGGAPLTRYLLPVLPLLFLLAADAASHLHWAGRKAVFFLLPCLFVASWFWNPPYPFGYEDNLAYADFVRLQQAAAPLLEQFPSDTRILTAWPASDELTRPWLGYVRRPLRIVRVPEFSMDDLQSVPAEEFDVLFLYSRQWRPEWFDDYPRLTDIQRRYFGYKVQAPQVWIREHFGMELQMRTELRGQWVEIWVKTRSPENTNPSRSKKIETKASANQRYLTCKSVPYGYDCGYRHPRGQVVRSGRALQGVRVLC